MLRILPLTGLFLMGGCTGVQTLGGESISIVAVPPVAPASWQATDVSPAAPATDWLADFEDPVLSDLVREAVEKSTRRRGQAFNVRAVRAQARAVYGRTLPNASLGGRLGATSNFVEIAGNEDRINSDLYGLEGSLSWQVDLWGRLAAGTQAAEADLASAEAQLRAVELSVAGETAIAWFDLNEALAQEEVARETVLARQRALELTERRFSRGLSTALDVRTARTTLASAEAAVAARQQARENAVRRLETLLVRYPAAELAAPGELPRLALIDSAGVPADVLRRRPDILADEATLTAAGLRAEQARLALYPALNFSGSVSTSEGQLSDALNPERLAASLIAGLAAPVFNGGALDAEREAAIARARAAAEAYVSTVLTAWREVEDALAADRLIALQEAAQARALEQARLAEELAERQYTNGLVSIFNLIDSQTRRLNAESSVIAARAARASNRVRYHLARGGGVPFPISENIVGSGSGQIEVNLP